MRRERGRRRSADATPESNDLWLLTYGDLVTTLMAFFVLLYSLSSVSAAKFKATAASLAAALGNRPVITGTADPAGKATTPDATDAYAGNVPLDLGMIDPQLAGVRDDLRKALQAQDLSDQAKIELSKDTVIIRFSDQAFFNSGDATLQPRALPVLDAVAAQLKALQNDIRVEGHTDSEPISTPRFPSNFDLSAARASSVAMYLMEFHHIAPAHMSIAGYGPYHPVAANDTPEGRAQNRRVDIVILPLTGQ